MPTLAHFLRLRPEHLPGRVKKLMFLGSDLTLVPISLYVACALRYGDMRPDIAAVWPLFTMLSSSGLAVIWFARLHLIKLHTIETRAVLRIGLTALALAGLAMVLSYALRIPAPRSVPIIFAAVFFMGAVFYRLAALGGLNILRDWQTTRPNVVIYGAGAAGMQLAAALAQSREARPVAFVDESPQLQALMIGGLHVYPPFKLGQLIRRHGVTRVILAIPSLTETRRAAILETLAWQDGIEVQVPPSFADLITGKTSVTTLQTVTPDALLGRDRVDLDVPEIAKTYAGRNLMVTGAGGSIGSELCRQLIVCRPHSITLFELNEYNLYEIDQSLRPLAEEAGVLLHVRLGSVTDRQRVTQVMEDCGIDIVLHAAAYKHVPLVEINEVQGAKNNVLGTQVVAEVAAAQQVERFILVSTDKAVRPTNVMGATKRMAEMLLQDMQARAGQTKFAMVRFGNVLGSSGSVLPLFQQQIANGGPVTVTHPDVTRYFMTIPEAARLVLLAGAYAEGGDVFLLDMGAPQKIVDIARRMIALSGRRLRDEETGEGDIAITFTGLRPGEKLYEELLIDDDQLVPTPHPKILRAQEAAPSQVETATMLSELERCIDRNDAESLRCLIAARVSGYHRQDARPFPRAV